ATFTDANAFSTVADFTASITWGDGGSGFGTIITNPNGGYAVMGSYTYDVPNTYTISVQIFDDGGSQASAATTATISLDPNNSKPWVAGKDPPQPDRLSVGEFSVAPNTAGVQVSQPLAFYLSPGISVGGDPALVYNSDTVNDNPVVQAALPTDLTRPVP